MSNSNTPVHIPSDDEEPKSPSYDTTRMSETPASPPTITPTTKPLIDQPTPNPQPQPQPPSPSQAGPSRWKKQLQPKPATFKRTARIRTIPPPVREAEIKQFLWVRDTLDKWRSEEGLKAVMDDAAPFPTSRVLPITREPVERTVPPLVVRVDSHDRAIGEWRNRHRQLDTHVRGWVESRLAQTESSMVKGKQDIAILQAKMDIVETENAHLKEDVEELTDTLGEAEEYIDLIEDRVTALEHGYAHIRNVAELLAKALNTLPQHPPPPPPPTQ